MLGNIFLTLALVAGVFSAIMYFLSIRGYENTLKPARIGFYVASLSVLIASGILLEAILNHRYELKYVYSYSSDDLSLGLLMSTFYAGQEGSFMIWLLFTMIVGSVLINYTSKRENLEAPVMFVFTMATLFLLVMVSPLLKSPFHYIWQGASYIDLKNINPDFLQQGFLQNFIFQSNSGGNAFIKMSPKLYAILNSAGVSISNFIVHGRGLNPLLQNFWMQIHPPMLFIGFALTTVPFAFAMASLIKNEYKDWVRQSLPWTLASVMILGLAIMLGGYWSYGVLGWGGYWGWDPVENSSLIPWLVGVALVHTMLVQRKSLQREKGLGKYARTNLILAILTYLLVLYSTFLTRSGILGDSSVHSFVAPGAIVYFFLIVFIVAFFIWSTAAIAMRWKYLSGEEKHEDPFLSREMALFTGAVTLLASAIIVFVGTSAPIFGVSVETKFYDQMNLPIAIIIGLLNGLSILLKWGENKSKNLLKSLTFPFSLSVMITILLIVLGGIKEIMFVLLAFSAVFTFVVNGEILIRLFVKKPLSLGAYLTHVGVAIFLMGVITVGGYSKSKHLKLVKGQPQQAFGYNLTFTGYSSFDNNQKYKFHIKIDNKSGSTEIAPVMYISDFNNELMREPSILNLLTKDIYITPLSYNNEVENGKRLSLVKGKPKLMNGVSITFVDFQRDPEMIKRMAEGSPFEIGASIKVTRDDKSFTVVPKYIVNGTKEKPVPVEIPELNLKISLAAINAAGSVDVIVSDLNTSANVGSKEYLEAEVSIKPFVGLLWLGVLVITFGFLIAVFKRTGETRM